METSSAVIYTYGNFESKDAKTTHALIRGSDRYTVKAVIHPDLGGRDAGELLDGRKRNIPVYPNVAALKEAGIEAEYFIIGMANIGGLLNREWFPEIKAAMAHGMNILSAMHEPLGEIPEMLEEAKKQGIELIDIRTPKPRTELHFWTGEIAEVECPIIAVLGMDCAVGKRTTAKILTDTCRSLGKKAEMIFTGQTGWLQGWKYGFILDTTLNDFVGGELEHAILSCWRNEKPDIIFVEGQAAMRNPSGPCGPEFLVSGKATGVVVVHPPARVHYKGWDKWTPIPPLEKEIRLIEAFDVPVLGIALNTQGLNLEEAKEFQAKYREELKLPVALPIEEGVEELAKVLLFQDNNSQESPNYLNNS